MSTGTIPNGESLSDLEEWPVKAPKYDQTLPSVSESTSEIALAEVTLKEPPARALAYRVEVTGVDNPGLLVGLRLDLKNGDHFATPIEQVSASEGTLEGIIAAPVIPESLTPVLVISSNKLSTHSYRFRVTEYQR